MHECMIWTESGVWLQTIDGEGRVRLSGLGKLSLVSVQDFCRRHKLPLSVVGRAPAARGMLSATDARARPTVHA